MQLRRCHWTSPTPLGEEFPSQYKCLQTGWASFLSQFPTLGILKHRCLRSYTAYHIITISDLHVVPCCCRPSPAYCHHMLTNPVPPLPSEFISQAKTPQKNNSYENHGVGKEQPGKEEINRLIITYTILLRLEYDPINLSNVPIGKKAYPFQLAVKSLFQHRDLNCISIPHQFHAADTWKFGN